jgi:acyl dehydratase
MPANLDDLMTKLHLDDFTTGQVIDLGEHVFTKEKILAFANEFDPQSFHIDEAAAAESNYGGLIASGWHTGSVFMRLLVDGLLERCEAMGSPGVDELRWLAPVRPDDRLSAKLEITDVRPSKSRPDRGFIIARAVMTNQDAVEVLTFTAPIMLRRQASE